MQAIKGIRVADSPGHRLIDEVNRVPRLVSGCEKIISPSV